MQPQMSVPGTGARGLGRGVNRSYNGPVGATTSNDVQASLASLQLTPRRNLNPDAPAFVPRSAPQPPPQPQQNASYANDAHPPSGIDPNVQLLQEVQVGLEQLLSVPGEFLEFSEAIADRLCASPALLPDAVCLIIHMACSLPLTSYPLGRLCSAYCAGRVDQFQPYLLSQCHQTQEFLLAQHDHYQLRNFAQLMAELFTHLTTSTGRRLEVLGRAVITESVSLLADSQNVENLKCVSQILKCCGKAFDELDNLADEVNSLFHSLSETLRAPNRHEGVSALIENVLLLRRNGWVGAGVCDQATVATGAAPLMIGPDGQPMSEDELSFLDEHFGRTTSSDSENEQDAEMAAAYAEFLAAETRR